MPSLAHQGAAVGGDQARSFSAFSVLKGDFGILSSHGGSSHLPQRLDRAMAAAKDNFFGQLAHDGTQAQREGQQQQRASIVELIHAAVLQLPPAERESLLPLSFQLKAAPAEEETLVMQRWNERVTRLMVSDPPPPAEVDQSLRQLMKLLINLHQLGAQPPGSPSRGLSLRTQARCSAGTTSWASCSRPSSTPSLRSSGRCPRPCPHCRRAWRRAHRSPALAPRSCSSPLP